MTAQNEELKENSEDDVLVQAKTVVSDPPKEIGEGWAREQFPDADYVEVRDRTEARFLVGVGDEPYPMICPVCGEGVHSGRTVGDGWYYRHIENEDCELDARKKIEERREERQSERRKKSIRSLLVSGVTVAAVMWGVFQFMPSLTMTINGETTTMDPSKMVVPALMVVGLMVFIMFVLQYAPGHVKGGRYA